MTPPARKQRPRAAPDLTRFKPCARCALCHPPAARWPEGAICAYCYNKAKRTNGSCRTCGHDGVLPGLDDDGHPVCRSCSGIKIPVDCSRCGAEAELYRAGTCRRCALVEEVAALLAGTDGRIPDALRPLSQAITSMRRANSGITWLRSTRVRTLLRQLACGEVALEHEALDALPASRTVEYIRGLLVEQGVLPGRDKNLAAYLRWLDAKLTGIAHPEQRKIIEAFARWHHVRRLRQQAEKGAVSESAFLRAKQSTTLAIEFLAWLGRRGRSLSQCCQHDVDSWLAAGSSTRTHTLPFLYWALRRGESRASESRSRAPTPTRHSLVTGASRPCDGCSSTTASFCHGESPGLSSCSTGSQPQRIVQLTTHQVRIDAEGRVLFRPARDWLDVPEPLASLLAAYIGCRANTATAANPDSPWLFPGVMLGQPLKAAHMVNQLRSSGVPVMAARSGTWQQLVREAPPSVLAEALGISPMTAMKHAQRAGADWQRYAALRKA